MHWRGAESVAVEQGLGRLDELSKWFACAYMGALGRSLDRELAGLPARVPCHELDDLVTRVFGPGPPGPPGPLGRLERELGVYHRAAQAVAQAVAARSCPRGTVAVADVRRALRDTQQAFCAMLVTSAARLDGGVAKPTPLVSSAALYGAFREQVRRALAARRRYSRSLVSGCACGRGRWTADGRPRPCRSGFVELHRWTPKAAATKAAILAADAAARPTAPPMVAGSVRRLATEAAWLAKSAAGAEDASELRQITRAVAHVLARCQRAHRRACR